LIHPRWLSGPGFQFTISHLPFTIPAVDPQTQREFLVDIEELIAQLFADIEELRQHQDPVPFKREMLERIFRHIHSLKGVAATAGFNKVSGLAHQTETLLDEVRSGRLAAKDSFVEQLEEGINAISEGLSTVTVGTAEAASDDAVQARRGRNDGVEAGVQLPDLPAEIVRLLNESEKQLLWAALRESEKLYLVAAEFDVAVFDKQFHKLRSTLTENGAVISSLPSADSSRPDRVGFRVFCSSPLELAQLRQVLAGFPQATVEEFLDETRPQASPELAPSAPVAIPASSIRIGIEDLDRLISASHELLSQTMTALDLISSTAAADSRTELKNLGTQIGQSLVALEEQIVQLRMVSPDRVMQRAVRAGRVAARVNGKEIEFSVAGNQLRIDKSVADAIADPLLHLVRNAVDQGIETPEERVRAGKPRAGSVRLEASSAGGRVRFLVSDDGRGIDPAIVSQAAAKMGLIENGSLLSTEMCLRLIFRPGFSTTSSVSSLSGRGVGLAVVESAVERAGGAVRVRTQGGKGTEFEIRLPATLGFLRALVIVAGGVHYCVDARQIVDHLEIEAGEILRSHEQLTLPWRDEFLPLADIHELLAQPPAEASHRLQVLVCALPGETADLPDQHQAVTVEAIEGTQEVLVRGLGRHAALWPGVVGASELRDGSVALVLDLSLLLSLE
jgi:two-component system chemotaxis sensor kinase CheA